MNIEFFWGQENKVLGKLSRQQIFSWNFRAIIKFYLLFIREYVISKKSHQKQTMIQFSKQFSNFLNLMEGKQVSDHVKHSWCKTRSNLKKYFHPQLK